jgi:hypothetical protein
MQKGGASESKSNKGEWEWRLSGIEEIEILMICAHLRPHPTYDGSNIKKVGYDV